MGVGPKEAKTKGQRKMRDSPAFSLGSPTFCSLDFQFQIPTGHWSYTQEVRAVWTLGVLLTEHLGWFWGAGVGVSKIHG